MNTECFDCIFLESEENENITSFCKLNKLKLYHKKGIKIIKDNKNGSPILEKFSCAFKRTKNWINKNNLQILKDNKKIEDLILKENGFPFSCFIFENENLNIENSVDQLLNLDHKPKYIHITFRHMHQDEHLLLKLSEKIEKHKIKYKLVINLDKELDHFYESTIAFLLNVKTPFIAFYNSDYNLRPNFTTELSEKIQKELLSFPYANTENKEFILFPISIIKEYIQETGEHFLDRIFDTQCLNYKL